MPITPQYSYRPLSQAEFGPVSYEVFSDVIAIRKELGRFFDEKHYKKALAQRRKDVILEAPILVSHQSFKKFFFLDVLIILGGVFEFKVVEALSPRHKAQPSLGQHQPSPHRHSHGPARVLTAKIRNHFLPPFAVSPKNLSTP